MKLRILSVFIAFLFTPVASYAAGSVNPFGDLIPYIYIIAVILFAIHIYYTLLIFNKTKDTSYRYIRYIGILSGPLFWLLILFRYMPIFVDSVLISYLYVFLNQHGFAVYLILFLSPFICWAILSKETTKYPNKAN